MENEAQIKCPNCGTDIDVLGLLVWQWRRKWYMGRGKKKRSRRSVRLKILSPVML